MAKLLSGNNRYDNLNLASSTALKENTRILLMKTESYTVKKLTENLTIMPVFTYQSVIYHAAYMELIWYFLLYSIDLGHKNVSQVTKNYHH